ncbi:MAG: hypothetical protein OJF59_002616 [Cytophagales bacterium]|nr:MAG: hypothetical protein OJF59_002616 [Cytophagales bacterium]
MLQPYLSKLSRLSLTENALPEFSGAALDPALLGVCKTILEVSAQLVMG